MKPVTHKEHMKQFTLPVRRSLLAPTPDWLTSPRRSWRAAGPRRLTPGCHWRWRWSPCPSPWCQHGHADVPAVGGRRLPAAPSSEASCPFYWGEEEGGDVCFSTCFLIKWLITHLILNILWLGDFATYCLSNIAVENRSVHTYRCYLCAFLSPCSSTLMISGSRWAGSLGLSRYSKTFLPYLLLMTSSRDDRISWTGGNRRDQGLTQWHQHFTHLQNDDRHPTSLHF